ncbi:PucR family transcriptional regulator [Herbiconiux liangxiaofengii]|uniref:PucR family transcriptional regulator n=1 Tax=Herbiconiux liangxiaofengii TaxID=3342795 RepID=UPI0035BA8CC0
MPTDLAAILKLPELALELVTDAGSPLPAVDWAHGSDLDDPSPFLAPGHLLLTTGRQFDGYTPLDYAAYVGRVARAGVVAIGFGTEVLREGTPPELADACRDAGLPLILVPYRTPFIAVSRAIADREAASARARVEWALSAQDAVARAVGRGGLSAAVDAAAGLLDAEIWVLDADAAVLEHAGSTDHGGAVDPSGEVTEAAAELLRQRRRARIAHAHGPATLRLQTLGSSGRHQGVLGLARVDALDAADESVVTTLTALAELALEHADDLRLGHRSIMEQLFQLLRDGRVDLVRRAAEVLRIDLPAESFVVIAAESSAVSAPFRDSLERRSSGRGGRFVVAAGPHLHLIVDESAAAADRLLFDARSVSAGVSEPSRWSELDVAVTQAVRALDGAPAGRSADFSALVSRSFFGLLATSPVAEVARARLARVRGMPDGDDRLRAAEVWLRHNGHWEPAARELGLHRHSLRLRMESLGDDLGLALDGFQGRAELWALLAATDLDDRPPGAAATSRRGRT